MDNVCESGKRKAGTGEGLANTPARLDDVMNKNQVLGSINLAR